MNKKKGRWVFVAVLAIGALVIVFYFLSDAKRRQWVGVPDYQPFGTYQEEPAAPGSGPRGAEPKAVEPTTSDAGSAIHGEINGSMAFSGSDSSEEKKRRHHHDHPPVLTPSCDPAVLDAIGQTLLTTFGSVCDPLLATLGSSLQKLDALGQVLLGSPSPLPEIKLPDLSARALATESAPTVVDWIVSSQSRLPVNDSAGAVDVSHEAQLQNLLRQTQTSQDAPSQLSSSGFASSGASALGGTGALGGTNAANALSGTTAGATSALSGTTGMAKGALQSLPRGH